MKSDEHKTNNVSPRNIIDELWDNQFLFLFIIGLLGFLILNVFPILPSLNFKQPINIAELFWGTAIVLAIVERSIELFIIAWRNPRKEELEQNIRIAEEKVFHSLPQKEKQEIEEKKGELDEVKQEIESNEAKIKTAQKAIKTKQKELENQQKEEAKLLAIKSVIETLEADILQLEQETKNKAGKLQTLKNDHLALLLRVNPVLNPNSPAYELNENRINLVKHKKVTSKYALYLGLLFGLIGSIAGIRILEPLVDLEHVKTTAEQIQLFNKFDLMVSALGIAGGTKLFHGLPNLISDTLSSTSSQIKAIANKPPM